MFCRFFSDFSEDSPDLPLVTKAVRTGHALSSPFSNLRKGLLRRNLTSLQSIGRACTKASEY